MLCAPKSSFADKHLSILRKLVSSINENYFDVFRYINNSFVNFIKEFEKSLVSGLSDHDVLNTEAYLAELYIALDNIRQKIVQNGDFDQAFKFCQKIEKLVEIIIEGLNSQIKKDPNQSKKIIKLLKHFVVAYEGYLFYVKSMFVNEIERDIAHSTLLEMINLLPFLENKEIRNRNTNVLFERYSRMIKIARFNLLSCLIERIIFADLAVTWNHDEYILDVKKRLLLENRTIGIEYIALQLSLYLIRIKKYREGWDLIQEIVGYKRNHIQTSTENKEILSTACNELVALLIEEKNWEAEVPLFKKNENILMLNEIVEMMQKFEIYSLLMLTAKESISIYKSKAEEDWINHLEKIKNLTSKDPDTLFLKDEVKLVVRFSDVAKSKIHSKIVSKNKEYVEITDNQIAITNLDRISLKNLGKIITKVRKLEQNTKLLKLKAKPAEQNRKKRTHLDVAAPFEIQTKPDIQSGFSYCKQNDIDIVSTDLSQLQVNDNNSNNNNNNNNDDDNLVLPRVVPQGNFPEPYCSMPFKMLRNIHDVSVRTFVHFKNERENHVSKEVLDRFNTLFSDPVVCRAKNAQGFKYRRDNKRNTFLVAKTLGNKAGKFRAYPYEKIEAKDGAVLYLYSSSCIYEKESPQERNHVIVVKQRND